MTLSALRRRMRAPIPAERDELAVCLRILELHQKVHFAYRCNTGAVKFGDRFVKFGPKGQPDILGLLKGGRFLCWEVKRRKKMPNPDQAAYLLTVRIGGGFSGFGTAADLVKALEEL